MNTHANLVGIIKKDIYIIRNNINTKVYIGQSIDVDKRFKRHCKKNNNNSLIDEAIKKYGKEHFYVEVLEHQVENYNEREKYWIRYYNSQTPFGYNILSGGEYPPRFIGDNHPNVKIEEYAVELLKRDLKETNIPLSQLAAKYHISKRQVLRINQGISREKLHEKYPIRKNPNKNGKLSESDVDIIIELLKFTYRFNGDIARAFDVDVHTISNINQGISHHRNDINYPIRKWKSCGVINLTYEDVTNIINLLANTKQSLRTIAKKYNVNKNIIGQINRGSSKKYFRENISYPIRKF